LMDPQRRPEADQRRAKGDTPKWMAQAWRRIGAEVHGKPAAPLPRWAALPALTKATVSSPIVAHAFDTWNAGKSYANQVKPFNFMLSAHVDGLDLPADADVRQFHLVAPFEKDPRKWTRLPWIDHHSRGQTRYNITTQHRTTHRTIRVQSYADVLSEYARHPESKSAAADGSPADEVTLGLLQRRHFRAERVVHIGKEAAELEEREAGALHDSEEAINQYENPKDDTWTAIVRPVLKSMPRAELAGMTGLSERRVQMVRNGAPPIQLAVRAKFVRAAGAYARSQISDKDLPDLTACIAFREVSQQRSEKRNRMHIDVTVSAAKHERPPSESFHGTAPRQKREY